MVKSPLFPGDRPALVGSAVPVPRFTGEHLPGASAHPATPPSDPLSEVVSLLRPRAVSANLITGKGSWAVRYGECGMPGFCVAIRGRCMLEVEGHQPLFLHADDFVLLPATPAFTFSAGEAPDMRALGGAFQLGGTNPALLLSMLPPIVHIRGSQRLSQLVALVGAEAGEENPGRDFMLSRLVEAMLMEALRQTTGCNPPPGLLRGLGDERLAPALAQMHARVDHAWTVAQLARVAALSRSAFYERFTRKVGMAPMEYLQSWRMQIARDLLRAEGLSVSEVATRVGYSSVSTFSVAFTRQVGQTPARYARG